MFFRRKRQKQSETIKYLQQMKLEIDNSFKELKALIKENQLSIQELDNKLFTKDLKDKQMYGMLHYKLHEVKPKKKAD